MRCFPPDCGYVTEDEPVGPQDAYGISKAEGELTGEHCLTIRCSIVGPPAPRRRSGLWAWVCDQAPGATVPGYINQIWSGMTTQQLAAVCAALVEPGRFAHVRAAGAIHHLAPNPVLSKYDLVAGLAASASALTYGAAPADAPQSVNRILVSRHRLLDALAPRWPTWADTLTAANQN